MSENPTTTVPDAPEAPKKSKKKLFLAVGLVVVLAGVAYVLFGRGGAADADIATHGTGDTVAVEAPAALEFSEIVDLPAININLADGHYLRVAVSLGLHAVEEEAAAEGGHGAAEVTTDEPSIPIAPAEDLVVALFSGRTMASLATLEGRDEAKALLTTQIIEHYGATVTAVFLTEFVMQ